MTRHVVAQLVMFVVISLVAILFGLRYVAGPDTFGDPLRLSAELDNAAGLARGTSVNYRGVGVGTVESVDVSPSGSGIVLGIELHPGTEIPIGSVAKISTENPVGIQSLDIMPTTDQPPYLVDGDVIAIPADGVPKSLDATLVQATDLVNTLDVHDLSTIADTFGTAFQGTGPDLQNLLDNSAEAAQLLDSRTEALTTIVDKGMPLLDSADGLAAALPGSASTARNVFEQLQANDAALVDLMGRSPQTMASLDSLLAGNRDSLGTMLADLVLPTRIVADRQPSLDYGLSIMPTALPKIGSIEKGGLADLLLVGTQGPMCVYDAPRRLVTEAEPREPALDWTCQSQDYLEQRGAVNVPRPDDLGQENATRGGGVYGPPAADDPLVIQPPLTGRTPR
ncbi:MlaD family protein [Rhodococcus sp. ZPP]|uniref:MCE family protein n=1 Tax=Rhodococcus sp. ZPP TaxID=2749906 RepID=UPI001FCB3EA2|nr:MlaD family protein [Rhodococcus sp. ZPP]